MIIKDWLPKTEQVLKKAGITTARLDCLVLLEDELGKDRAWLLAHSEQILQRSEIENLSKKIDQRARHVPLAYIRGKAEFYGREFSVNAHTLVPRPETETMIELLKRVRNREADIAVWEDGRPKHRDRRRLYKFEKPVPDSSLVMTDQGYKVVWQKAAASKGGRSRTERPSTLNHHDENLQLVDVGTGSGAIAITAKLEFPETTVTAIDIDAACLKTARQNARKLEADIEFLEGNLLESFSPATDKVLVLLCNLPYVPDNFQINTAATHEPRHALFGGTDGLDLYRELFEQIASSPIEPAYVLTESLPPQHETLADIAKAAGYQLAKTDDFIQLFEL